MESLQTITRLKSIIARIKKDEGIIDTFSDDARIIEEIGLDSLAIIELMLAVEEEFSIELVFGNIDIKHLYSIRSLADFLCEQKQQS